MTLSSLNITGLKRQRGSFTIELVFVIIALGGIYLFAADLSYQLLVRAKLDRSSFALVNIIKERSRYFEGEVLAGKNLSVTNAELRDLTTVASRMLDTPPEDVAIKVESLINKRNVAEFSSHKFRSLQCNSDSILEHADLAPVEKGKVYPLYRVTLCEENRSWLKPFFDGGTKSMVKIASSSIMPGR
ncbi:tight adherence pilus pseudopilin TadF [Vibrio artabrorum]|uniref:tight adherence pilus pseudopilin TadF n=1 Tax=Vibrio artabrorum TaxID=446374 RepID=UPI00354E6664